METVMRAFVSALFGMSLVSAAALAQTASDNGRYSMTPTQGGFLRLDTRSGEVALCRPSGESVECRAAAQERQALDAEIDRLARENAELKSRLASQPPSPALAPPSRVREELDRALEYAESFMRRIMRLFRDDAPADRI
jgi:hypothetical protein